MNKTFSLLCELTEEELTIVPAYNEPSTDESALDLENPVNVEKNRWHFCNNHSGFYVCKGYGDRNLQEFREKCAAGPFQQYWIMGLVNLCASR